MKNLFSVNKTQSPEASDFDEVPYLSARVSEEVKDKLKNAFSFVEEEIPQHEPTEEELVEIAVETAKCAKTFGVDPKVAFLSYSTKGSGKGEDVDKMRNACAMAKEAMPDIPVDGEMQFDAAVAPEVAQVKCKGSKESFMAPSIPY